jgi:hypothetical protein
LIMALSFSCSCFFCHSLPVACRNNFI